VRAISKQENYGEIAALNFNLLVASKNMREK
jgi:hypothetical protein